MQIVSVAPETIEETGVRKGLLEELATKILFLQGEMSLVELADHLCVSIAVVEQIFQFLRKEQLCEVKGMSGGTHRIAATDRGKSRATELLAVSQYAGAAPVSLTDYATMVRQQTIQQLDICSENVASAFDKLVIDPDILARLGTALVSGTSLFLYGPSGTGKTSIAECIPAVYDDNVWIPHAVEVDNQIISVYDSGVHRRREEPVEEEFDRRWVRCYRPRVVTGGEFNLAMLELQFSPTTRHYAAPVQMKANNGVLIVDDLGRQRVRPEELLNRWITPLDRRLDFLTLPGGRNFEIPFDIFVVFATNLNPSELADDAFLRRIPNKIKIGYATKPQFQTIFRKACDELLLDYDEAVLEHLVRYITVELNRPLCSCYPRDILRQILWNASYRQAEPKLDKHTVEQACRNYFLSDETQD